MGSYCATDPAGQTRRPQAERRCPRRGERSDVHPEHRLPMAGDPQGPATTLFGYFELWDYDGTLDRIHHSLYVKCREAIGREASPTACVIDSQSVNADCWRELRPAGPSPPRHCAAACAAPKRPRALLRSGHNGVASRSASARTLAIASPEVMHSLLKNVDSKLVPALDIVRLVGAVRGRLKK